MEKDVKQFCPAKNKKTDGKKWIIWRGNIICPTCHYYADRSTFNFCPNCGQKMNDKENMAELPWQKPN